METVISAVLAEMQTVLKPHQLKRLADTLRQALGPKQPEPRQDLLSLFLTAKEVEGCSPKTIEYYEATLRHMDKAPAKPYTQIESDDLRRYLNDYEVSRGSSKVTIDNIRRIMSSFFSWLEDEDYIVKSPVRRIHRVKTAQIAKEVLSDEELEALRGACDSKRDLAIVDLLASTGMRIGELVRLNRKDVNLHERECLVTGKGNKQRPVYFDARAKLHLSEYLASRNFPPRLAAMHNERYADMAGLMGLPKTRGHPTWLDCRYLARSAQQPVLPFAPLGQVSRANGIAAQIEEHPGTLVEALAGKSPRTARYVLAVGEESPGRRLGQVVALKLNLQHVRGAGGSKLALQRLSRETHLVGEVILGERRHIAMGLVEKVHTPGLDGQVVEVALYTHRRFVHDGPLSSMLAGPPRLLAGWRRDR